MTPIWLGVWHWFQEVTGTNNGIPGHTPRWYNFQSAGLAFTALAAVIAFYWHHNCHQHRCPRWARYKTAAGDRVCKTHHPDMGKDFKLTAEHIKNRHDLHKGSKIDL